MTDGEHGQVIETVVRTVERRVPVVAGCGSNDTRRTLEGAQRAAEAGADALLVVTPYYNKPNRSGMIRHFRSIAEAVALPLVVYNVPGRTGQNLGVELTVELAGIPGVVGVKEASGDLQQIAEILDRRPSGFAVLSGDDALALPTMALGADGVISVASNEAPAEMAAMMEAALRGDYAEARRIHYRLRELMEANFVESNPVPVKTAMALLGFCEEVVRSPLGPATEETRSTMGRLLEQCGLRGEAR